MRELLEALAELLQEQGESRLAAMVEDAISGPDHQLEVFLVSNELWGGAGSIADRAGVTWTGHRTEGRRRIERSLVQLGTEQIRVGKVNSRTAGRNLAFDGLVGQPGQGASRVLVVLKPRLLVSRPVSSGTKTAPREDRDCGAPSGRPTDKIAGGSRSPN